MLASNTLDLRNHILARLAGPEYEELSSQMETVRLAQRKTIYRAGEPIRFAYFPVGGMASLLFMTEEGKTIEVGATGNEGMVGIPLVLGLNASPYEVTMHLPGVAVRIRADRLRREFARRGRLHDLLLLYTNTLLNQISQSVACNSFHTVEERFCRSLLTCHDRVRSDTLQLTQEFQSHMLGVPRTSITSIVGRLQKAGLINAGRGTIRIVDKPGLEQVCCECYGIIKKEIDQLITV